MTEPSTIVRTGEETVVLRADTGPKGLTAEQYEYLLKPIRGSRILSRTVSGKSLSYVQAWDIKAHLTRIFGFGNWDSEVLDYQFLREREYVNNGDKIEVVYSCRVQLTIRDQWGQPLCRHSEAAVGSTSGPVNLLGEIHDNALKTAESDALKRCAINLGTQFGLSLYNDGSLNDVIKVTLVKPADYMAPVSDPEAEARVTASLGATPVGE